MTSRKHKTIRILGTLLVLSLLILFLYLFVVPGSSKAKPDAKNGQDHTATNSAGAADLTKTPGSSDATTDKGDANQKAIEKVVSILASEAISDNEQTSEEKHTPGWQTVDNEFYFYDQQGQLVTSWFEEDGKTYFSDHQGKLVSGLQEIEGNYYYFESQGFTPPAMLTDKRIRLANSDYLFDANGQGKKYQILDPENVVDGLYLTDNNYELLIKDGVASIDGIKIVNKTFSTPESVASELTEETLNAFYEMEEAFQKEGMDINLITGYRTFYDQRYLYQSYLQTSSAAKTDYYSARPGYSEHHLGEAIDIGATNMATALNFGEFPEAKWASENAAKFGFILRYPQKSRDLTGYDYEPWHFRYVGKDLAPNFYQDGEWITMEEYYGIPSKYSQAVLQKPVE